MTMDDATKTVLGRLSRRDTLRLSGLALGGLALGGSPAGPQGRGTSAAKDKGNGSGQCQVGDCYPTRLRTDAYSYFDRLPRFDPLTPLDHDEMRISFMGSMVPPNYRAQEMMSIFVQVGNGQGLPDQAVFDCGSGVCSNYNAMGVGWGQMNKIFLSHLHGDHMSDISYIYQSGPQADRKTPLFVFGPGPSNLVWTDPDGNEVGPYDDGTKTFCEMLRAMLRWQSEGFCFQSTGLIPGVPGFLDQATLQEDWHLPVYPEPVRDPRAPYTHTDSPVDYNRSDYLDDFNDGYAVVPIELPWRNRGGDSEPNIAYHNKSTGLKITHFPVIHTRQGAIGYKLEWNGLSMMYTSDTKPETNCINQANNIHPITKKARGVDVFIHEMAVPPEIWAMKIMGLSAPGEGIDPATWQATVDWTKRVQDSSHTPQGAFGYILSQIKKRPRLTVPTHFPTTDDTVACALKSVQAHVPDIGRLGERIVWSYDLMVLRVYKDRILQHRAAVSDYSMVSHSASVPAAYQTVPKYWKLDNGAKVSDPEAQLDLDDQIPRVENGKENWREDGY
jgi:ribonuclease Z